MINIDKKPKMILICGHEVRVKYKKKLSVEENGEDIEVDGLFHPDKDMIEIKACEDWRSILLHEILHAVLYYSGNSETLEETQEESIVMALENGLKSLGFF